MSADRYRPALLPGFTAGRQTYAPGRVWKGSTRRDVKFMPLAKKMAVRIFHDARRLERQTRRFKNRQDGALGRNGIAVLHALLFDHMNYTSDPGRLDPGYASIAQKACISIRSVARGLAKLKAAGILNWVQRCFFDGTGLKQGTNAYAVLPQSQWKFFKLYTPPAPPGDTWGKTPVMTTGLDLAADVIREGGGVSATILESDPGDGLSAATARLDRILRKLWNGAPG